MKVREVGLYAPLLLQGLLTEPYLQSLRKFLVDWGQSSVNRSTTKSPLLVSSITAMSTNRVTEDVIAFV